uniref:Uncharacterized protein n=1 Tax=Rhizophora mucronata TaxID=61149 RepID=A0A2P2QXI0_RHIMU
MLCISCFNCLPHCNTCPSSKKLCALKDIISGISWSEQFERDAMTTKPM